MYCLRVDLYEISQFLSLTYLASPQPLSGLHILPSPIIPSARCERGAKSPDAPTVPFSGTQGRQDAEGEDKDADKVVDTYVRW